jgi:beta-galactosidase/beta-glucuronidase
MDNQQENIREDNELMYIYEWVDSVPLTRAKKNIARDFSDAVLMAELIKHHIPRLVELHNYPPASSTMQKFYNWSTLNSMSYFILHEN